MTESELQNHIAFKAGGGSAVVFIHGIEDDGTFWFPIDRVVSNFRRVVTVDLLGFGHSPKDDALTYTLSEHVTALKNTIERELGDEKITLVSHSLGCYVALEYTKLYPKRVEKLILSSPVIILEKEHIKPRDNFERLQMFFLSRIGFMRESVLKKTEAENSSPTLKNLVKSFWPSIKNLETLVEKQDVPNQLSAIKSVPIVINYGALDPLVINSDVEHVIKNMKNVTVHRYGVGHDVVHAKPVELFSEIVPEVKQTEIPEEIFKKRHRVTLDKN
jgi:cis-3-alkyl-4-acyloxetan-2-one decarboxylase